MSEPTRVERAAVAVVRAWNDPGRFPRLHEITKTNLGNEWRILHAAIEELAAAMEDAQEEQQKTSRSMRVVRRAPGRHRAHGVSFYAD